MDFGGHGKIHVTCLHPAIGVRVEIAHLADQEGGLPNGAVGASLSLVCADCAQPFRWVGLGIKRSAEHPGTSPDGTTLMVQAEPAVFVLPRGGLVAAVPEGNA